MVHHRTLLGILYQSTFEDWKKEWNPILLSWILSQRWYGWFTVAHSICHSTVQTCSHPTHRAQSNVSDKDCGVPIMSSAVLSLEEDWHSRQVRASQVVLVLPGKPRPGSDKASLTWLRMEASAAPCCLHFATSGWIVPAWRPSKLNLKLYLVILAIILLVVSLDPKWTGKPPVNVKKSKLQAPIFSNCCQQSKG